MNHLLRRSLRSPTGLGVARQRGSERLTAALAARKVVDFAGPHGWEHSATNLGRHGGRGYAVEGVTGAHGACCRWSSCAPIRRLRAELATTTAGAGHRPRMSSTRPPTESRSPRTSPSSTAGVTSAMTGIAGASPHGGPRSVSDADISAPGRDCGRTPAPDRDRRPLRARARPRRVHTCRRNGRARRLPVARPPAQDPGRAGRLGAGVERAVVVSLRGGDFRFECGQDSRSATTVTTPRPFTCTSRRASASVVAPEAAVPLG